MRYAAKQQEASGNYYAEKLGAKRVKMALVTGLTAVIGCRGLLRAQQGAVHRLDWWKTVGLHRRGHVVFRSDISEPTSEVYGYEAETEEPEAECEGAAAPKSKNLESHPSYWTTAQWKNQWQSSRKLTMAMLRP